ncbi:MAG TPA: hypothetical protein VLL75_03235 [Vicinamibacteria bacterium]|nr:hypothetical protein [Vicinamibacteria bacterium]
MSRRRLGLSVALLLGLAACAALLVCARLERELARALSAPDASVQPLQFVSLPSSGANVRRLGSGEIVALALGPAGTWFAGTSGVAGSDVGDDDGGLPTLRASALTLWRGVPVVATESGGLFRRGAGSWEEARTGFGTLHVRSLAETEAGELLVGAKEGLFRAAFGSATLLRLAPHPVRGLAATGSGIVIGGEEGLFRVEGGRAIAIGSPDSWIESVGVVGSTLFAATATGLARGSLAGPLWPVPAAQDVASGVSGDDAFWGATSPRSETVRRVTAQGQSEERVGAPVLRMLSSSGVVFADTEAGLYRRGPGGWTLVRPRPAALPPGATHLSALALYGGKLVAGTFDGGLAIADEPDFARFRPVPGSAAWGINALLPAGGELYVASLRGAARFDGARLRPVEGPGAAFALAVTDDGVAIGYGQGVRLPGGSLVSAFHGLPGNQALALAASHELFVGTPSGLGALRGRRVSWRVAAGDSKLPHPWVTALAGDEDGLFVGTYGGGVARRVAGAVRTARGRLADEARYEAFPETEGLKINAGRLLRAGGRLYAGTDGAGLWRTSADGARFERMALRLPSSRVTAMAAADDTLFVGTDEGLARVPLEAER